MKVYTIYPGIDYDGYTEDSLEKTVESVRLWLEETEPGETVRVEVGEMSREEYDSLPEYMGP